MWQGRGIDKMAAGVADWTARQASFACKSIQNNTNKSVVNCLPIMSEFLFAKSEFAPANGLEVWSKLGEIWIIIIQWCNIT